MRAPATGSPRVVSAFVTRLARVREFFRVRLAPALQLPGLMAVEPSRLLAGYHGVSSVLAVATEADGLCWYPGFAPRAF
ncbi:MAG: hypothetical protein KF718_27230 [Polyangiaceae bacterium]|nr:hypothetical protein [Polyangiaceae bacterium]